MLVEALIAQPPVEGLDVRVLRRLLPLALSRNVRPRACAHVSIARPQNSLPMSVHKIHGSPRSTARPRGCV